MPPEHRRCSRSLPGQRHVPPPHFERSRPTLFLPASLLRTGLPAQREISLRFSRSGVPSGRHLAVCPSPPTCVFRLQFPDAELATLNCTPQDSFIECPHRWAARFPAKPEFVQLTEWRTARVPQGNSWMIFEVDSVAPSCIHPGEWVVHVRDYR